MSLPAFLLDLELPQLVWKESRLRTGRVAGIASNVFIRACLERAQASIEGQRQLERPGAKERANSRKQ